MGAMRIFNRKADRKLRASLKKICLKHRVTYASHCPCCSADMYIEHLFSDLNGSWDVIEKNPNRVARGSR